MREIPTREKALAFVGTQAPTAFVDQVGDVPVRSDSRTHLEAVLGQGNIPTTWELKHLVSEGAASSRRHRGDASQVWVRPNAELDAIEAKRDAFLDLLQSYIDALRPEGYGTCGTCAEWGEEGNAGRRRCHSDRWQSADVWLDDSDDPHPWTQPTFSCAFWHPKDGDARP